VSPTPGWWLDARLRRLLPCATLLVAVLLDLLPLPTTGPASAFLALGVVYYWSLYRPELLPMPVVFLLGVIYDAVAGLPLGLSSLILLLVRAVMAAHQRFFASCPLLVVWAGFLVVAPLAAALRWFVSCLWWGWLFTPQPILVELGFGLALFPLLAWLLGAVHARIPRPSA
jgi:rod shape-determining protein MreD